MLETFTIIVTAMLAHGSGIESASVRPRCDHSKDAMLALDQQAFDQGPNGWRSLAALDCHKEVADIIWIWRTTHKATATILFWHEGQARANAGQTINAIALFERSRKAPSEEMSEAWNIYVEGSIAFLKRDRSGLESARTRLLATKRPNSFAPLGADGKPIQISWPPNLEVLEALSRCWDQPYLRAYSCRLPH